MYYKLSARQILFIGLFSALLAAGAVFLIDRAINHLQPRGASSFTEAPPEGVSGITDPSVATDERNNIEVYKAISPGVVFITSITVTRDFFEIVERPAGTGTGSVIDLDGHILTNEHVVADARRLMVSFGGEKSYPATIVGKDPDTDLAVIKVNAPRELLKPVPFGDSDKLVVGQKVLAIGNPFGFDRTLTTGVISGLQRPIRSRPRPGAPNGTPIEGAIQTDASINPGNSGGPLLDSHGRMIGINSQILSPSGASAGVGFAVPVNIAKRVIPQLIRNGAVIRPKLGISLRNVRDIQARLPVSEGVVILGVDPNGSAGAAGLRGLESTDDGDIVLGDIITGINGEAVKDSDDLFRILDKYQIGDVIKVEVWRNNGRVTVPVKLLPERRGFLPR